MNYKLSILTLIIILLGACNKNDDDNEQPLSYDMTCIPSSLHSNVIAFYPFSKGSLDDFSANTNDLTNTTSATSTSDRNNNPNCAYIFDNRNNNKEFLTATNVSGFDAQKDFSISLWYKPVDTSIQGKTAEVLLSKGETEKSGDKYGEISVNLYDCRKAVFAHTAAVWEQNTTPVGPGFSCRDDVYKRSIVWSHLTAVYTHTSNTMTLYVNNILQGTITGTTYDYSSLGSVKNLSDIFVGVDYTGFIDDIIIFNKALSQSEISQLYQMEPCCSEN